MIVNSFVVKGGGGLSLPSWTKNKKYRQATEKRFKEYYVRFKYLFDGINSEVKNQIIVGMKNRMFSEGLMMESITFDSWIKHIMKKY